MRATEERIYDQFALSAGDRIHQRSKWAAVAPITADFNLIVEYDEFQQIIG